MGVSGTVGVLQKRGGAFRRRVALRDLALVVDVTACMYWFVKRHLVADSAGPHRVDLAGWSQVSLGGFFRAFFKRLLERNVKPIIVYSGARPLEQTHGRMAAKCNFLESSCRATLRRQMSGQYGLQMPDLCLNALKEVINEFGFDQVHQACFESHKLLARLAERHDALVLTSHSDFIFTNSPRGFVWTDDLEQVRSWPLAPEVDVQVNVYEHARMLAHFNIDRSNSAGLSLLYVLLRDDFSSAYHQFVNESLRLLSSHCALGPNPNDRMKTQRLLYALERWPSSLGSLEALQERLGPSDGPLRRDFEAIQGAYEAHEPLGQRDKRFISDHFMPSARIEDLNDALTRRECSAQLMLNLRQRDNFNRMPIEDIRATMRSSFSIGDRVRQYLLAQLQLCAAPRLFDRNFYSLEYRPLRSMALRHEQLGALTKQNLFNLFHFDEQRLERLAEQVERQLALERECARRLALLLLIARFGYRLATRDSFDNAPARASPEPNHFDTDTNNNNNHHHHLTKTRSDSRRSSREITGPYLTPECYEKYLSAIINSFAFHATALQHGDTQSHEVPAEQRVMRRKLTELQLESLPLISAHDTRNLIANKHLVEVINASLHYYKELNSLYNFPGPNIIVHKYYDGVLVYTILTKWSNSLKELLLCPTGPMLDLLRL